MRTFAIETSDLARCVAATKTGQVVVTRKGKPVAVLLSVRSLDAEQIELGSSNRFWKLIDKRRQERTLSLADLEARIAVVGKRKRQA